MSLPAPCGCRATACRTRTSSPSRAAPAARPSSAPATCRGTAPRTAPVRARRTPARSAHAASRTPRSWRSTSASTEFPTGGASRATHPRCHTRALPYPGPVYSSAQRERPPSFLTFLSRCVMPAPSLPLPGPGNQSRNWVPVGPGRASPRWRTASRSPAFLLPRAQPSCARKS